MIGFAGLSNAQDLTKKDGVFFNQDGDKYTGIYNTYFTSGEVEAKYHIEDGLLDGEVVFFHQDGAVKETGAYASGEKDGTWMQWNTEGIKTAQAEYVEGIKDGVWIVWDDQGNKRYHMVYQEGDKIDVWKIWDEQGNLLSERSY